MLQYLVILGAAVQVIGIFFYLRNTVRGVTRPNRVTWLMWAVAPLIATAAAFSDGVRWAIIPVFMSGFGPLLVFIASYVNPKSYWKLGIFDYICGAFSILALVLWGLTKEPSLAIIFAIVSDGFAATPTIIKAWRHPGTESIAPYMTGAFSAATSFFAMKMFSVSEIAFPAYLILINSTLIICLYSGRKKQEKS